MTTKKTKNSFGDWRHTHTVTDRTGTRHEVYLDPTGEGAAYSREEWEAEVSADIERRDDGGWYFLGEPLIKVERA